MDDTAEKLRRALMNLKRSVMVVPHFFKDLSMADMSVFWAMHSIFRQDPTAQQVAIGDLVKRIGVSKPAITQNINKLEDKGLVQRVTLKSDRRATYVQFTDKGTQLFDNQNKNIKCMMQNITDKMGKDDTEEFIRLLDKFKDVMKEIGSEMKEEDNKNEKTV